MRVKGITGLELSGVVADLNSRWYNGNIMVHITDQTRPTSRAPYTHVKVGVYDSYGYGARHSWSGRHGPWACWHVFRDIIAESYRQHGERLVWWTSFTKYENRRDFLAKFPQTAERNIGSMFNPVTMPDLCGCLGGYESFPIPVTEDRRTRVYNNRTFPPDVMQAGMLDGFAMFDADWEQEEPEEDHSEALESMAGALSLSYDQMRTRYAAAAADHAPIVEGLNEGHTHDPNRHLPPEFYDAEDEIKSWKELMDDMAKVREARKGMKR